jgi:hypothetical protein
MWEFPARDVMQPTKVTSFFSGSIEVIQSDMVPEWMLLRVTPRGDVKLVTPRANFLFSCVLKKRTDGTYFLDSLKMVK